MKWEYVYEDFDRLGKTEKLRLFEAIKSTLFPEPKESVTGLTHEMREARFNKGVVCPHCQSKSVKRNGKYRSRQRYLCKDCARSFNDVSVSPLSGTRYADKWLKYFEFMVEGYSLRKIAEYLDIHLSTAFYWRHKILNALRSLGHEALSGIVESDETYFLESDKGKKEILHRKPRKRGGVSKYRGISHEQICVLVAVDRSGKIFSQTAGRGRITSNEIDNVMGEYIPADVSPRMKSIT